MRKETSASFWSAAWLWGAIAGLLAGAIGGYGVMKWQTEPRLAELSSRIAGATSTTPLPPEPEVEIIPIESRPLLTSLPAAFDERRRSPLVELVVGGSSGAPLAEDAYIGTAIALTSDGWLVTPYAAIEDANASVLSVARAGKLMPIARMIRDRQTDMVYLKVEDDGFPVADFVPAREVTPGAAVWIESLPSVLRPASVMSIRARSRNASVSSESANRRFLISGNETDGAPGRPVWDGRGKLVGLYERFDSKRGGWLAHPVSSVSRDLANLISNDKISHAGLSIFALDLEGVIVQDRPDNFPAFGAWLRPGEEGYSIARNSPAFGVLQPGDVIERIERDILEGEADLGEILLDYRPGATVTLTYVRADDRLETVLTLQDIQTSVVLK